MRGIQNAIGYHFNSKTGEVQDAERMQASTKFKGV